MIEFFKEILGIYKEKTKLPIISTYLIVLIVWNWDIVSFYLFASPDMEIKIYFIKDMVKTDKEHWLRVLYPILIAFVYPFASLMLTFLIEFIMNPVKMKIKDIQLGQRKEAAKKLLEIEQERTGQKDLEQLRTELKFSELNRNELVLKLSEVNDLKEKQNEDYLNNLTMNSDLQEKLKKIQSQYDLLKEDYNDLYEKANPPHRKPIVPKSVISSLYNELNAQNIQLSELIRIKRNLNYFSMIEDTNFTKVEFKFLLDKNIIEKTQHEQHMKLMYRLSDLGNDLVDYINEIKKND